jgi:hypothetical protein
MPVKGAQGERHVRIWVFLNRNDRLENSLPPIFYSRKALAESTWAGKEINDWDGLSWHMCYLTSVRQVTRKAYASPGLSCMALFKGSHLKDAQQKAGREGLLPPHY